MLGSVSALIDGNQLRAMPNVVCSLSHLLTGNKQRVGRRPKVPWEERYLNPSVRAASVGYHLGISLVISEIRNRHLSGDHAPVSLMPFPRPNPLGLYNPHLLLLNL